MTKVRLFFFLTIGLLIFSCSSGVDGIGKVVKDEFESEVLGRKVAYNTYFPPGYSEKDSINIIYLLHGHGGDREDWFEKEEGNVSVLLDSLINNGIIRPTIAVSISAGNSWYVDSKESMETFYIHEFVPAIEKEFSLAERPRRIIAGNSAGGYGALRFALKNPGLFEEVILLSPAAYEPLPPDMSSSRKVEAFAQNGVFNDSIWNIYSYTHRIPDFVTAKKRPNFYLSVGDDDAYNIVPVVTALQQLFLKHEVVNELRITNGGHDWNCWRENFSNALQLVFE